ncbi:MAG: hypothetical protein K5786_09100, partial [Treponema sp.]|nr:hypothetical protein [Treponema sp.]
MTSGQKIAFSLLVTLLLFAGFILTVKTSVFEELETRFYAQSKIQENVEWLDTLSESTNTYINNVLYLIDSYMKSESVRSFYLQNPSEKDVNERRLLTEELFKSVPSLSGLRIVDKNGRNVHFSTFDESDVLKQSGITKFYKYYNDIQRDTDELQFEVIAKLSSESENRVLFDEKNNRLILSVPFFWLDGLYSGLGLFYLDVRNIERALGVQGALEIGETITLFSDEQMTGKFVMNVPVKIRSELGSELKKLWAAKKTSDSPLNVKYPEKLLEMEDGRFWVCLSDSGQGLITFAGLYTSDMFEITKEMEFVIYTALFVTIFLLFFLFFSLFDEPVSKMKKRIKKLQYSLISDFIESKDKIEWNNAVSQLRNSRADMSAQIMKGFRVRSKKKRRELSEYLDASWNEIISVMEDRGKNAADVVQAASGAQNAAPAAAPATAQGAVDQAMIVEMRRMMEKVLFEVRAAKASSAVLSVAAAPAQAPTDDIEELEDAEEVEEIEEIEEAEEVEELDDAEEVEELDEVEEVEELDDAEEVEELDEADEVEELDDADDIEELEDAEEIAEPESQVSVAEFVPHSNIEIVNENPALAETLGLGLLNKEIEHEHTVDYSLPDFRVYNLDSEDDTEEESQKLSQETSQDELQETVMESLPEEPQELPPESETETESETVAEPSSESSDDYIEDIIEDEPLYPEILSQPAEQEEVIEELTEEVPLAKEQDYFSMTSFSQESKFYG